MKLLLISSQYRPTVSGSCRLLQEIVEFCLGRGHTVEVLTYGPEPAQELDAFDQAQKYPIHRVLPQRLPGTSSLVMLARLVRLSRSQKYDLVLCGFAYPSAVLAYLARVFFVVYSHGEDVTVTEGSRFKSMILSRALRSACAVMTNSRFARDYVIGLGVPEPQVAVVPPGIDPQAYEGVTLADVEKLRADFGLGGKRVILTVARLAPRKGHDMIIRALPALCRENADLHYLVVGKGDPRELAALARIEGVEDRVTFVEYVPDASLPALYHLCDVYAMVSRWDPVAKEVEGFGIVYLEAAACGKPCVAGSAGGAGDAVEEGITGFVVDPLSIPEISRALKVLLDDPVRAAAMGAAGQARVREKFSKSVLLGQAEKTLTEMLLPAKERSHSSSGRRE